MHFRFPNLLSRATIESSFENRQSMGDVADRALPRGPGPFFFPNRKAMKPLIDQGVRTGPEAPEQTTPAPRSAAGLPVSLPGGPLRFRLDKESRTPLYEQIREQIISALHMGRIQPGHKLPSVRQFARVHKVNPKTIHRIYRRLSDDGYVELRAGSGAYIAPIQRGTLDGDRLLSMHRFFQHTVEECGRMGVDPQAAADLFASFVSRRTLWNAQIAVVEENREHLDLLAHELRTALGVRATPVALRSLESDPDGALANACIVVTTDFHFETVRKLSGRTDRPVLQVQLHPEFVPSLMRAAEAGHLLMVVSDTSGMVSFVRALSLMGLSQEACERIRIVEARDPVRLRREALRADAIYASPLVEKDVAPMLPSATPRLKFEHHISSESLDLIEAAFLFGDEALAR
jgi:DNA-binding transcriptional regulator YhcF (GntR family)